MQPLSKPKHVCKCMSIAVITHEIAAMFTIVEVVGRHQCDQRLLQCAHHGGATFVALFDPTCPTGRLRSGQPMSSSYPCHCVIAVPMHDYVNKIQHSTEGAGGNNKDRTFEDAIQTSAKRPQAELAKILKFQLANLQCSCSFSSHKLHLLCTCIFALCYAHYDTDR